ncbi:MAG: tyrosine-type recombinase/integrase [Actinomycetota bacterium]|nr:tyrosine-type recombinase/integrase [Actinomycetota bacterium]
MAQRRSFGGVEKLPSGRYRARFRIDGRWVNAPTTFATKTEAAIFLDSVRTDQVRGAWKAPRVVRMTVNEYGQKWIEQRQGLKASTRAEYESCWRLHIGPYLGDRMLDRVTPDMVRDWNAQMRTRLQEELAAKDAAHARREQSAAKGARKDRQPRQLTQASVRDGSATVARAYRLLHSVYGTAVEDDLVTANPCRIKGASSRKSAERPVLSIPEVLALAKEVPERYEALVHLLVWSGLRIGEASALQRRDIDLTAGFASLSVRERVYPVKGVHDLDTPKSRAGIRTIAIPQMLAAQLEHHLKTYTRAGPSSLIFTTESGSYIRTTYYQMLRRALNRIGRPDMRPHDLRHTGMTLAAEAGASLAELKHRLGQSTTQAAEIYLHATVDHGRRIADRMDELAQEPEQRPAHH